MYCMSDGSGKIIREVCEKCKGKGRVKKQTRISVTIPAGIDDSQTVVLRNEGAYTLLFI